MTKPKSRKSSPPSKRSSKKSAETPRPYLSWSQFDLFRKKPEEYRRRYFLGEQFENEAMRLGKRIATSIETGMELEDEGERLIAEFMPRYPKQEFEISADCEGVPLFGKLDGFCYRKLDLGEYKTGRVPWTQRRADTAGQLTFYALMVYLKYGKLPSRIRLYWAPTEYDQFGNLQMTGEIKTFDTSRSLTDVAKFVPEIKRVWAGIQEMFREEAAKTFV